MSDNKVKLYGIFENGYGFIPKKIMIDNTITLGAKGLYAYLCSFSGRGCDVFPSRKKICSDLDIGNEKLSKHLKELITKGYIKVEQDKLKGKFINNTYIIVMNLPCTENADTVQNDNGKSNTNNNIYNNNIYNDDDIKEIFSFYDKNIGQMNSYIAEELQSYFDDFNKDMILLALKKTADNGKHTINYVKAILNNWNKNNIHTISEVKNYDEQKTNKKENKTNQKQGYNNSNTRDYNFDDNSFYAN